MGDRSLRDALEKLAGELEYDVAGAPGKIRALLAAHPAEPAPVVTDGAVDYLGRWKWGQSYDTESPHQHEQSIAFARQALEGLLPLFGPRPLLDRGAALRAIVDVSEPEGSDCILGREYVENYADVFADAVMELARPMPTQEQIAETLREAYSAEDTYPVTWEQAADAVLALLNGAES